MLFHFKGSHRLYKEVSLWEEEGLITHEQATALYERYELKEDIPWYLRSGFILKALALLLAGLGMFLFISQNWDQLSIPLRVATGIIPLLLAYVFGLFYYYRHRIEESELAFFLASIAFGVNIFLQAQIFHISAYYPNGILWWMAGVVPVAFLFRSRLHTLLLHVLYFSWLIQQIRYDQLSLGILLFATLVQLLWLRPGKVLLIMTSVNFYLTIINIDRAMYDRLPDVWLTVYSITLVLITVLPLLRERFDERFLERLWNVLIAGLSIIFFIHTFKGQVGYIGQNNEISFVTLSVLTCALVLYFRQKQSAATTAVFLLVIPLLALNALRLMMSWARYEALETTIAITMSVLFFAYALWRIFLGLKQRRKMEFMMGVLMVIALAISRYFDYFDSYLIMSLVFIASGGLLLFVNSYWNRKYAP